MDEYSSKRATGGGFSGRGSSRAFRNNNENRSIQYSNHLGRSNRHNSLAATEAGDREKLTSSRPAFLSTSSRVLVGNYSGINVHKKPQWERGSTSSLQESVAVEANALQEQIEDVGSSITEEEMITMEVDHAGAGVQTVPEPVDLESSFVGEFSIDPTLPSTEYHLTSSSRTRKSSNRMIGSGKQVASSSSSVRYSIARNVNHRVEPSPSQGGNVQRHGLRNLSCTSISDVLPPGCSSDIDHRRTDSLRKRYTDVPSSSARGARGKGIGESSNGGRSDYLRSSSSGPCLYPFERPSTQPTSRRTRNQLTGGDGGISVRNQRSYSNNRRLAENVDASIFSLPELVIPPSSRTQFSFCEATAASSSQPFPTDTAPFHHNSSGRSGSSSRTAYRLMGHSEDAGFRIFRDPWVDRDGYQHFNMEGIAEILLALERIEQDEELTYEQLMVLESNLLLGGISLHDQHRDMRLDIDNMSYEELLELEEKMGTVSTALSEEALSKCLERSSYTPLLGSGVTCSDDNVKCSICQEEYIVGDEVGKLHCDHRYHVTCIHQWLRQKNWCPVCKSPACPS